MAFTYSLSPGQFWVLQISCDAAIGVCIAGQKVDLTARIREILLNYPEGNSIAKELVQNADDAGARTISFCLDERHHGTESLLAASLQSLQGPALLVHNDSTFSEGDFESISNIGASIKRAQEGKTGDVFARSGSWPDIGQVLFTYDLRSKQP